MRRYLLCILMLFVALAAVAQQDYVSRFDTFAGYSYLATPNLSLNQNGVNFEGGVNATRWLALGADYSYFKGSATLLPNQLVQSKQDELNSVFTPPFAYFPPPIPAALGAFFGANPGYTLKVPYDASTWTFAAGPQINYRHFKAVTLFIRPDLGVLHESVTAKPGASDLPANLAVAALVPGGKKSDNVVFYGVGGGFDLNVSKHLGIRSTFDYVHCFLFKNLLADSRNSFRFSVGPTFRFGGNVKK